MNDKKEMNKSIGKQIPTMKKWGIFSWATSIIITLITIIGVFFTEKDMAVMGIICGLTWAETSVYDACYCVKEKASNKLKMSIGFIKELADKYGIEAITPILQGILQD